MGSLNATLADLLRLLGQVILFNLLPSGKSAKYSSTMERAPIGSTDARFTTIYRVK